MSFPWFQPRTKCPWIAAASATMLFAAASCEMAARCPENLVFSQCRPFNNLQIWWRGRERLEISPRNIKMFSSVLMLLNH